MDGDRDDGAPVSERVRGMSRSWPRMPFSDAVEVNPRRPVLCGTLAPFVDMAALPAEAHGISVLRTKPVGGGGSRFANGDTLFARITPCTENGKTGLVDCLAAGEVATGSTEFIVLAPRFNLTLPRFVYYLAKNPTFRSFAISRMRGTSGRQRVPVTVFDEFEVGVPPLSEQRKIAAILSSVDDAIERTRAVIDQVQVVKRGLMQEMLTRGLPGRHTRFKRTEIGWIPEEWSLSSLPGAVFFQEGPGLRKHLFRDHGMPFINIRCIKNDGTLDLKNVQYIAEDKAHESYQHFFLEANDTVLSSSGTLGRMAVVQEIDLPLMLNTSVIRFRTLDESVCTTNYMRTFLSSEIFLNQVVRESQGSAQANFGPTHLKKIKIPLPSVSEQKNLSAIFTLPNERLLAETAKKNQLENLKTALMSILLTGELRVTPNSETP